MDLQKCHLFSGVIHTGDNDSPQGGHYKTVVTHEGQVFIIDQNLPIKNGKADDLGHGEVFLYQRTRIEQPDYYWLCVNGFQCK